MRVERLGVVGCGLLGSGIAQVAAQSGLDVVVREISQELVDRGLATIEGSLERLLERGTLGADERDRVAARLRGTTTLEDLADRDLVIEAIIEQRSAKLDLFRALDAICRRETVFASNTSSLSITDMAAATSRPERFLGLHFFNPVPTMKLVEVVPTPATDASVVAGAIAFVEKLGKTAVVTGDRSGFIVNRLLVPYLLDAVRVFDEGAAAAPDIDRAMKLGCGHPMGPLALADLIGLDTLAAIAEAMVEEFHEPRFAPPPLLKRLVRMGWTGRKGGKGFYDYRDPKNPTPVTLR